MRKNQNIINAMKRYAIVLAFFCVWESIFFVIANAVVKDKLLNFDIEGNEMSFAIIIINLFIAFISIIIDIGILQKILNLKSLLSVTPVKCVVEDYIITSHTSDGDRRYNVSLLVKNTENQELLFSYGKYSLSYYNYSYSKAGQSLQGINIFRKDGSTVEIGDEVYVYISEFVDVSVDYEDKDLKLNNKKFAYIHTNENYNSSIFENVRFYKGAVEVEKEYC